MTAIRRPLSNGSDERVYPDLHLRVRSHRFSLTGVSARATESHVSRGRSTGLRIRLGLPARRNNRGHKRCDWRGGQPLVSPSPEANASATILPMSNEERL